MGGHSCMEVSGCCASFCWDRLAHASGMKPSTAYVGLQLSSALRHAVTAMKTLPPGLLYHLLRVLHFYLCIACPDLKPANVLLKLSEGISSRLPSSALGVVAKLAVSVAT
jgi:hypothetical protein